MSDQLMVKVDNVSINNGKIGDITTDLRNKCIKFLDDYIDE